ncbi:hypothetical protein LCGC14_0284860 [marine sediment metagenome]|uniref:Uncharacterized protein n=1 Tax=marine sediment metagenome TaxID=412755 RepID=A0A0F9UBV8_9ZZZZ|nr:hypothetical protein [Phycisphaerae bacterium]HDZ45019.1 hypothetical protein [Phycisphaerae bacterium]
MNEDNPPPRDMLIYVVGGLLLIIVVSLGALWVLERRRAVDADLQWRQRCQQLSDTVAVLKQLALDPPPAPPAIGPDTATTTKVVDGQPREVLQIGRAQGRRLGLPAGAIVEVLPGPSASQPAGPFER